MWRRRGPAEDEFREEVEAHIALETDRLIEEGLEPDEAAAKARRTFGNTTRVHERFYESRHFMWLDDLRQDVRFTLRSLRRSPGFAAIAVLTLAVGLGANTAIFSVVNAVLLQPLPYADPGRLVLLEHPPIGGTPSPVMAAWRARAHSLADLTAFEPPSAATLVIGGQPTPAVAARVTPNFFSMLGVPPTIGRLFSDATAQADAHDAAVLTYSFWHRAFGGDPAVLGRTITLTGDTLTIVGVTARNFRFPTAPPSTGPALFDETQPDIIRLAQDDGWLQAIGRLSPTSTPKAASAELHAIFNQAMSSRFPPSLLDKTTLVATPLQERLVGATRHRLLLLMGAVGCVLLVVCANVANLLLARTSSRQAEYAIRAALGARTARLARLVLTESLLLATSGAVAALLLAHWTGGLARSMLAEQVPQARAISIDWSVLTFSIILAAVVGLMSGLASIAVVRPSRLATTFHSTGGRSLTGRMRLRRGLLAAEIAVTFVLVVTAALLSQTLWNLYHSPRGFDGDRIITAAVERSNMAGTIPELQPLLVGFFSDVAERVRSVPGVSSAAVASNVPLTGVAMGMSGVTVVGQPGKSADVSVATVSPGYFETIGTRLLSGRDFGSADIASHDRVAIVNDALRRQLAPHRALVGARITFNRSLLTVIGVVEDTPDRSLRDPARPFVYMPLAQMTGSNFAFGRVTLVARSRGADPAALVPAIRQAVWALGSDIVIDQVATMDERVAASVRTERDGALLFGLLAGIALVVAMAGVYGVVAYSVVQRTREIGLRIALGSGRGRVVLDVVRSSAVPVAAGIVVGLAGAAVATRAVASTLFDVQPTDPLIFSVTAIALTATALAAAWIPARRAAQVDPVTALRAD